MKKIGFEPMMFIQTIDLQSTTLNHSVTSSDRIR